MYYVITIWYFKQFYILYDFLLHSVIALSYHMYICIFFNINFLVNKSLNFSAFFFLVLFVDSTALWAAKSCAFFLYQIVIFKKIFFFWFCALKTILFFNFLIILFKKNRVNIISSIFLSALRSIRYFFYRTFINFSINFKQFYTIKRNFFLVIIINRCF